VSRFEELDAYVTREMSDADAEAFEEALFDAPDDPDLVLLDRIARHGAKLAEHGTFDIGVPAEHIQKLIDQGYTVHVFDAGLPSTGVVTINREADFIVTKLDLGRTDLERVDVELTVVDYNVTKTIKDVLVDPTGVVYGLCERPLAELAWSAGGKTITKVRRTDGARDVVGVWHLSPAP
jgi:hypothetical protein